MWRGQYVGWSSEWVMSWVSLPGRRCYPSLTLLWIPHYFFHVTVSWTRQPFSSLPSLMLFLLQCFLYISSCLSSYFYDYIKLYNPHKHLTQLIILCRHPEQYLGNWIVLGKWLASYLCSYCSGGVEGQEECGLLICLLLCLLAVSLPQCPFPLPRLLSLWPLLNRKDIATQLQSCSSSTSWILSFANINSFLCCLGVRGVVANRPEYRAGG